MREGAEAKSGLGPDGVLRLAQPLLPWEARARLSPPLGLRVHLWNMVRTERDNSEQVSDPVLSTQSALSK